MQGHFGADFELSKKGKYGVMSKFQLKDGKTRISYPICPSASAPDPHRAAGAAAQADSPPPAAPGYRRRTPPAARPRRAAAAEARGDCPRSASSEEEAAQGGCRRPAACHRPRACSSRWRHQCWQRGASAGSDGAFRHATQARTPPQGIGGSPAGHPLAAARGKVVALRMAHRHRAGAGVGAARRPLPSLPRAPARGWLGGRVPRLVPLRRHGPRDLQPVPRLRGPRRG